MFGETELKEIASFQKNTVTAHCNNALLLTNRDVVKFRDWVYVNSHTLITENALEYIIESMIEY